MRRLVACFAALALASLVGYTADTIEVEKNPTDATGFAVVKVKLESGDDVLWEVSPKPTLLKSFTEGGYLYAHFNGPVGTTYTVVADTINWDKKKRSKPSVAVTIGKGPRPPPIPDPVPDPEPDPQPTGAVKRFLVVEDTSTPGAWRGSIMGSPQVASFYKTAGLSHRLLSTRAEFAASDPDAKYVQLAAGKKLPYLWTFDASGKQLFEGPAPIESPVAFLKALGAPTGETRAKGYIPATALKFAWTTFGDSPRVPLIPRANWKPVDLSTFLPPVYDQDGVGACNAFATITAMEACRAQAGLPYVHISPGYLYGNINGQRDQGSMLEDGLSFSIENGTCLSKTVGDLAWRRSQWPASAAEEAKRFRVVEAFVCPDFDAMASALQQGFFIIEGLMWYDNFEPDSQGWLPSSGRGGAGGHALCGYGLENRDGKWGIKTRNSWSSRWGIKGDCIIPESLFGRQIGGYWAVRAVVQSQASTTQQNPVEVVSANAIPVRFGGRDRGDPRFDSGVGSLRLHPWRERGYDLAY